MTKCGLYFNLLSMNNVPAKVSVRMVAIKRYNLERSSQFGRPSQFGRSSYQIPAVSTNVQFMVCNTSIIYLLIYLQVVLKNFRPDPQSEQILQYQIFFGTTSFLGQESFHVPFVSITAVGNAHADRYTCKSKMLQIILFGKMILIRI